MARPKKTLSQYRREYLWVLMDISHGVPLRKVSKKHKVSLSTCMRLKKKFFWPHKVV